MKRVAAGVAGHEFVADIFRNNHFNFVGDFKNGQALYKFQRFCFRRVLPAFKLIQNSRAYNKLVVARIAVPPFFCPLLLGHGLRVVSDFKVIAWNRCFYIYARFHGRCLQSLP